MKKAFFAQRVGWGLIGLVGLSSLALASQRHRTSEKKTESSPSLAAPSGPRLEQSDRPPEIGSLLKPEVLRRLLEKREVMTFADLSDGPIPEVPPRKKSLRPLREYRYYTGVLVKAPLQVTRSVIRDYQIYTQLVPYIDRAELLSDSGELALEGGIWRYRIRSRIRFEEIGERWIRFQITQGHFLGMRGEFILEPRIDRDGAASTLVLVRGNSQGRVFPPDWVVEQGAQVVFSLTGNKIRSYIEENKFRISEAFAKAQSPAQMGVVPQKDPIQIPSLPQGGGSKNESSDALPRPRRKL